MPVNSRGPCVDLNEVIESSRYNNLPAWFSGSPDLGDYYDQATGLYLGSWSRDNGNFLDDSKTGTNLFDQEVWRNRSRLRDRQSAVQQARESNFTKRLVSMDGNRDIVIVTHDQDLILTHWCLKALDCYLKIPSRIYLYINHPDQNSFDHCESYLRPVIDSLEQHDVRVATLGEIQSFARLIRPWTGWKSQQLIKLFAGMDHAYLVIDPKDILINPVHDQDFFGWQWPNKVYWDVVGPPYEKFHRALKNIFGPKQYLQGCLTPQFIDPRIGQHILHQFHDSIDQFAQWFCAFPYPSEFFLYDYARCHYELEQDSQEFFKPLLYFSRSPETFSFKELKIYSKDRSNFLVKMHRDLLQDPGVSKRFDQWIGARLADPAAAY